MILLCFAGPLFSQSLEDLIIIDESADQYIELQAEFGHQTNVYFTDGNTPDALGRSATNWWICASGICISMYPQNQGQSFSAALLLPGKVSMNCPCELADWSAVISGKVVIHSDVVFTGDEGLMLKQQLESKTGLRFCKSKLNSLKSIHDEKSEPKYKDCSDTDPVVCNAIYPCTAHRNRISGYNCSDRLCG